MKYNIAKIVLIVMLLSNCKDFWHPEGAKENPSTGTNGAKVISVTVIPTNVTVMQGATYQFTANVSVTGGAEQSVTWTLSDNQRNRTIINASGFLVIAIDETATNLTVKTTSTVDTSKSGTATVTVIPNTVGPSVISVTVSSPSTTVMRGARHQFTANVSVTGGAEQSVIWTLSGNQGSGTNIDQWGLLTIAPDETATGLIVKATSTVDSTKSGTKQVEVKANEPDSSYFSFNSATGTITSYSSSGPKDVVIPSSINGVAIRAIGDWAFYDKQLTSVSIPNDVITIGDGAFSNNQLANIVIPNNVTYIGSAAFYDNRLVSTVIGNSVTYIGNWAFGYNNLISVNIPNNVTSIGDSAFSNNQLASLVISNSVTYIGDWAFSDNNLTSISIPDSVTTIGSATFSNNQLTSLVIGNRVTSIGNSAFLNNQLVSVVIGNNVTYIDNWAFGYNNLTSISIPNSVTYIGFAAFYDNRLTRVTIGANVALDDVGIGSDFETFYNNSGRQAGTYTRPDTSSWIWTKQ